MVYMIIGHCILKLLCKGDVPMYQIGDTVLGSHGIGEIIGMNNNEPMRYFKERPMEATEIACRCGLQAAVIAGVYNKKEYPYVVKWDDGYVDVYSAVELEVIPTNHIRQR